MNWDLVNKTAKGVLHAALINEERKRRFLQQIALRQQPKLGLKDYIMLSILKKPEESRSPMERDIVNSYFNIGHGGSSGGTHTGGSKVPKETVIKPPSYTDQFRQDVLSGTNRIKEGEAPDSVITELREKYPTTFSSTHEWNLKTIGKKAQAELGVHRNRAIQELKKIGYPTTENNIRSAIKQLRQPRGE